MLQKDLLSGKPSTLSVEVTQAYGVALGFLRQHLVYATDKVSDLVISALVLLIAFDVNDTSESCPAVESRANRV
jgi:hypothetical protein